MDIKQLQKIVIAALEDVKAHDIRLFDTEQMTSMFERLVVASGTSGRQTKALAASVRDKVKEAGGKIVSIEGERNGEWVLVDLGDLVVHIMQPTIRAYYQLEEIWGQKPINLASAKRSPRSAASTSKPGGKAGKAVSAKTKSGSKPAPASKPQTAKKKPAASSVKKKAPAKSATKTGVKSPKSASSKGAGKPKTARSLTKTGSKK